ncbi:MAG: 6-phosphofructokinase [Firmicutes bacterium]|jgi:6-phosphofructokinase 1|nr:6-phosphofructokinase [Bacillota bacterium]
MRKIAVLTSGGDAPGMNAAVRAVVRAGIDLGMEVYGVERGFAGLLSDAPFRKMELGSVAGIIHRGGTILRTARAPEFFHKPVQEKAAQRLKEEGIGGLVVIGGDGSFRGAQALEEHGIKTIGVPATIDNDIPGTENTIGFDTAVNTVLDAINRLRDTATSHERIFVVEVMGRNNGYIALMAGLAGGAESIVVPEIEYDLDDICQRLLKGIARKKTHSIILVAEGAASAVEIGRAIEEKLDLETRVTVLGHIQRGGTPTAADRLLASRMGAAAARLLWEERSGLIVGIKGGVLSPVPMMEAFMSGRQFPRQLYDLALILAK